jgi:ribosome-associated protein
LEILVNVGRKQTSSNLEEEAKDRIARSRELALLAAAAGLEKKALFVEIIDVVGKVDYADFLVLMNGTSDRHCGAIADAVAKNLSERGDAPLIVEGKGEWVLLDFFDVVVHVFSEDARDLYDISGLWMDAGRIPVPDRPTYSEAN